MSSFRDPGGSAGTPENEGSAIAWSKGPDTLGHRPERRVHRLRRKLGAAGVLSLLFLATLALVALLAPALSSTTPEELSLEARLSPPLSTDSLGQFHLLGTDALGRDVLNLLVYGARVSVGVALATVAISGIVGVALGVVAGYFRGRLELAIMRVVDVMLAFPALLLALVLIFAIGPSVAAVIVVIASTRWPIFARVAHSLALETREEPFITAAVAMGCASPRVIIRHVLPNVISPLLVLATVEVAVVVPAEAALSFLGLGVQPPTTSWGLMIADGRAYLETAWWLVALPAAAIVATTLACNVLGLRLGAQED